MSDLPPGRRKIAVFCVLFALVLAAGSSAAQSSQPSAVPAPPPDQTSAVKQLVGEERAGVVAFFGSPFPSPFETKVVGSRKEFDALLHERWGMERTECWMVAVGVADLFAILSPDRWSSEACEHKASDTGHLRRLVSHELVHVYHGQHNRKRDFDGMDDLGWFVEGLAVYASGQLSAEHAGRAREAVLAGKAPTRLADAWSGPYKYGVSGSLAAYVDQRWGRDMTRKLLAATTPAEALSLLGVTEEQLLHDWKEWVSRPAPAAP